jgi:Mrp family chromosome partitioning ATPase
MTIELVIVSTTPGLAEELQGYQGLQISSLPSLARARSIVGSDQPPQAIYIEDTKGTVQEFWEVLRAAQSAHVLVLLGLHGAALVQKSDFADAGLLICEAREASALASWIGEQLGLRKLAERHGQIVAAIAGAKGGIGKTLVVAMLAEGLRRRGLNVLVVDGDLSNSGLVPSFRIPSGFPSYLYLKSEGLVLQREFIDAGSGALACVCDVSDTPDDSQFANTPRLPAPTAHQMCGLE